MTRSTPAAEGRSGPPGRCSIQRGTDMLFEMIPAYLRFFDLPVATPSSCGPWQKFAADAPSIRVI